jgi:hypothetical protein
VTGLVVGDLWQSTGAVEIRVPLVTAVSSLGVPA